MICPSDQTNIFCFTPVSVELPVFSGIPFRCLDENEPEFYRIVLHFSHRFPFDQVLVVRHIDSVYFKSDGHLYTEARIMYETRFTDLPPLNNVMRCNSQQSEVEHDQRDLLPFYGGRLSSLCR